MTDSTHEEVITIIKPDEIQEMTYVLEGEVTLQEARRGLLVAIAYVENHPRIDRALSDILKQVLMQIDGRVEEHMGNITYKYTGDGQAEERNTETSSIITKDEGYVYTNINVSNSDKVPGVKHVKCIDATDSSNCTMVVLDKAEYGTDTGSNIKLPGAINSKVEYLNDLHAAKVTDVASDVECAIADKKASMGVVAEDMEDANCNYANANTITVVASLKPTEVLHPSNGVDHENKEKCTELVMSMEQDTSSINIIVHPPAKTGDDITKARDIGNTKTPGVFQHEKPSRNILVSAARLKNKTLLQFGKNAHQCELCGKTFPYFSHWKRHMQTHEAYKEHACTICDKRFRFTSNCKQHMAIHSGEKNYACSICDKIYASADSLRKHMPVHMENKPFSCPTCQKKFAHSTYFKRHLQSHTGNKPFLCTVCGKAVTSSTSLKRHIMTHSGDKPFPCKMCQKSFTCTSHLKQHQLQHSGVKPHSCTLCDKKFYLLGGLNVHMLTHSGEQTHSCTHCGKKFAHASSCKRHMLTHTGDKPHACSICQRAFTRLAVLKEHMLIHSDQASYGCSECGMTFKHINSCRRHLRTHTKEKSLICTVCDMRFRRRYQLTQHILTHKKDNLPSQ